MEVVIMPIDATNQTIDWSASPGTGTATINGNGRLIATRVGTVTVTATNVASGVTGTELITVSIGNQLAPIELIGITPITFGGSDGEITGTTTEMEYKLSGAVNYTQATETKITGLVAGSYLIRLTAKDGFNESLTTPVTVPEYIEVVEIQLDNSSMTLRAGISLGTLISTVKPDDATDKTVNWSSTNESIATVAGGVVTPVAAGTATITVTTSDGGYTATCNVTIKETVIMSIA